MLRRLSVLTILIVLLANLSFTSSNAQVQIVKDGKPCKLIDSVGNYKYKIDRLYSWDEKKKLFVHYRCVRSDVVEPVKAPCGQKMKAKFLRKVTGPECIWKMSLTPKTNKPSTIQLSVAENLDCTEGLKYTDGQDFYMVKDEQLLVYRCLRNPRVWTLILGPGIDIAAEESKTAAQSNPQRAKSTEGCIKFANSIIAYEGKRDARSLWKDRTTLFEVLRNDDRPLTSVVAAVNIMTEYIIGKYSAPGEVFAPPSDKTLSNNPAAFRLALNTFNSFCGTRIVIYP